MLTIPLPLFESDRIGAPWNTTVASEGIGICYLVFSDPQGPPRTARISRAVTRCSSVGYIVATMLYTKMSMHNKQYELYS